MPRTGRPRLSTRAKTLRGTLRPSRERVAPEAVEASPQIVVPESRDYVAVANGYVRDVVAGRVVACAAVRLACQRQDRDLKRAAKDPAWPYVWSDEQATAVCAFAEQLPHVEGSWSSPLIHLEPWQCFILTTLFGWRRKVDGCRRFNTAYVEVARKAAKSVLASVIGLYCLTREGEPGAQVRLGATTGKQARIVFSVMQRMVQRSAWLRAEGVQDFANAITHEASGSNVEPINAKSSTQDGLNPHCVILDELHAHKDRGLFDVLKSARGARKNPLSFYITTSGYNLLGVAYEQRTFVQKVLQQVLEADHYFGIIYTLDEKDDWRDERVWIKANPMLGITPQLDEMRQYAHEAQQSPQSEGEFKTKRLNLWLNAAASWLNMVQWDACADPSLRLEDFAGEPCWIGGDLGQLDDITAIALVFRRADTLYAFVRCYLPRLVVQERARKVPAYQTWVNAGLLTLTEGSMVDYSVVEADARRWCEQFDVRDIAFDQFGSLQIAGNLSNSGLPARLEPKNAKTFTPPARELETRVKHGRLRHDGNSCLKWMASNCVVRRGTDDSILPKKDSAESPNKIDGIDALLLAIGGLLRQPAVAPSMYDAAEFDPRSAWI
jgi:phage terminase large subunit-like protein